MGRPTLHLLVCLLIPLLGAACQGEVTSPAPVGTGTLPATTAGPADSQETSPTLTRAAPTLLPTEPVATAEAALLVPAGPPPTIDGTLAPGEWDNAAVETMADGSELLLMRSKGTLYLAIRSATPEMIAGNVFIDRGDEIAILHASAALGTALYRRGPEAWEQSQAFEWRCRGTGMGEAAVAERAAFLADEGWLAANSRMGTPAELEYRIELGDGPLRLAVNILRSSQVEIKIPWPADLDDDVVKPTPGGLPVQLHFSPDRWATIRLSP